MHKDHFTWWFQLIFFEIRLNYELNSITLVLVCMTLCALMLSKHHKPCRQQQQQSPLQKPDGCWYQSFKNEALINYINSCFQWSNPAYRLYIIDSIFVIPRPITLPWGCHWHSLWLFYWSSLGLDDWLLGEKKGMDYAECLTLEQTSWLSYSISRCSSW